jgi:hypothetical protein
MDQHHFDVHHAIAYGIPGAILLNNFIFWIRKNRANGVHFHEGRTWTYNSVAALQELFPYMGIKQIRGAIDKLIENDVLIKRDLSKGRADRSLWYALVNEEAFYGADEHSAKRANVKGHSAKRASHSAERASALCQKGESSIYTDKNTTNNTDNAPPSAPQESTSSAVAVVAPKATNPVDQVFFHWQQVMQCPRAKLDTKRRTAVQARLKDGYTAADLMQAIDGCRASDWHMGKNKDGKVFNDLELICRDAGKVDGFMAQTTRAPQAGSAGESLKEKNDRITAQVMRGGFDSDLRTIDMEA